MYLHISGASIAKWDQKSHLINTLRPRQNGGHFPDIFKCIFVNRNIWISIKISLKIVTKVLINNIPALVQIMALCRPGDKPLSEPMLVSLLTHICVTLPQWVKTIINSLWQVMPCGNTRGEWVFKLKGLSWTADNKVHVSCVIIICTLESLSSLTQITHNVQDN